MMEPMHELLQEAKKGGYGIPAPNVYNRGCAAGCR